jgi:hypothetical protein
LSVFKFNSAFRRNSYIERRSDEQAEYIRRIKEEPDFLIRELSAILRSEIIRHPEDVPRAHDWRDQPPGTAIRRLRVVRGLETQFAERFPPVTSERIELRSANAERFLGNGWSDAEADFRWTDGSEAIITFSLQEIRQRCLRLHLSAFLGGMRLRRQMVLPDINACELPAITLENEDCVIVELNLPAAALRDQNRLTLRLPNATSPASLGLSLDFRTLAVAARWMEFE